MATVRITKSLIKDTTQGIVDMHRKANTALESEFRGDPQYRVLEAEAIELMYKSAWGVHYDSELRRQMPPDWCHKPPQGVHVELCSAKMGSCSITATDALVPPSFAMTYYIRIPVDGEQLSPASRQLLVSHLDAQAAANAKYATIKEQVITALESFGSLNTAVKQIPALMLYIPQSYRDKLEEKVERNKRDVSNPLTVDTDMLSSVGVTHALGG